MELALRAQRAMVQYRAGGWRKVANLLSANGHVPPALWYLEDIELLQLRALNRVAARPLPAGYECRVARPDEARALAETGRFAGHKPVAEIEAEFAGYLADGHRCILVTHEGRIVGYDWCFVGSYQFGEGRRAIRFALESDMVFFGVGFILSEYRLKGLFPHLVATALAEFAPHTRFFTVITLVNERSLRSHQRLGFAAIGTLVLTRIAGLPYRWRIERRGGGGRRLGRAPLALPLAAVMPARAT